MIKVDIKIKEYDIVVMGFILVLMKKRLHWHQLYSLNKIGTIVIVTHQQTQNHR